MVKRVDIRDDGFTLTELIIVCALLAVILGVTYGGLMAVQGAQQVSNRQATFANEVGAPLLGMEEVLQQAFAIESAGTYSITVRTDSNNDNLVERHTITAAASGTLTHQAWWTNGLMQNTTQWIDTTWSTHNVNASASVAEPLFYYYDENHARILNTSGNLDRIKTIDAVVIVDVDGKRFRGTRTIVLRNR